jgi:L-fucose isomerase-like protein
VSNVPFDANRAAQIKDRFGAVVVSVLPDRLNAAYKAVGEDAAIAEMHEWKTGAERVIEPSDATIADAGRLYLAIRSVMDEERAQAVTINCLGLFGAKVLPAYPCLAFAKLNDLGLTGVCEADMDSTLTQLMLTYAFGVPGFVSDPVIDTSNNTVIHAHCVSATRMDGPSGPRAPYIIRSHLEDNKGASLQVKMRIGQVITMAKLVHLDTMLVSTGTIADTPDVDRGCRTKITTKVADARKVLRHYTGGLHRVIAYGDRMAALDDLATLIGLKVVQEC